MGGVLKWKIQSGRLERVPWLHAKMQRRVSVDYRGNFAPMGRSMIERVISISITAFAVVLSLSTPTYARSTAHCNPENTQLWIQAETLIAEGRLLLDRGSDMLVRNIRGWRRILQEAEQKSKKGYALKNQARKEANRCRMNAMRQRSEKVEQKQSPGWVSGLGGQASQLLHRSRDIVERRVSIGFIPEYFPLCFTEVIVLGEFMEF